MIKYNTDLEVLQDLKNGKKRPWKPKKMRNIMLSESLRRLGESKKANRVWWCCMALGFRKNLETGEKFLESAGFCRERLCPMCQWRKSIKVFCELSKVMDVMEQRHKNLVPVFLTLTVKNCIGDELSSVIDNILHGWRNVNDHRKMRNIIKGWFRALEVTYNKNDDTYHPHIHSVLLVDKSYFKGKDYMQTVDWVQLWRTSAGLDYDPICDIRAVKNSKGKRKEVAEVAKYTLKDTEYIIRDEDLTDKLVNILGGALYRRRLYAYGGILKVIAKELNVKDDGDLVHIDEDAIRGDIATVLEVYRWNFGVANYVKSLE